MTVNQKVDDKELQLDKESRDNILASEFGTDVEYISSKLGSYQLNSEKEKAWISSIDISDESITVEFLLPSTDTFTTKYDIPDKRLPEDNLFRKVIEETGETINTLELALGQSIDIYYNNSEEKWEPQAHKNSISASEQELFIDSNKEPLHRNIMIPYGLYFMISLPFILLFLRFTRGFGVLALIAIFIGYILIKSS